MEEGERKDQTFFFFLDCDVSIIGNETVKLPIITAYIWCDCYFDNLVVLLLICVFVLFWKVLISRHAEICADVSTIFVMVLRYISI